MMTTKWHVRVHIGDYVHNHWFLTRKEAFEFVLPFVDNLDCVFMQVIKVHVISFNNSDDTNHAQHVS